MTKKIYVIFCFFFCLFLNVLQLNSHGVVIRIRPTKKKNIKKKYYIIIQSIEILLILILCAFNKERLSFAETILNS